jgi:hypothetical protein
VIGVNKVAAEEEEEEEGRRENPRPPNPLRQIKSSGAGKGKWKWSGELLLVCFTAAEAAATAWMTLAAAQKDVCRLLRRKSSGEQRVEGRMGKHTVRRAAQKGKRAFSIVGGWGGEREKED